MEDNRRHFPSPGALFGVVCMLAVLLAPVVMDIDRLDGA